MEEDCSVMSNHVVISHIKSIKSGGGVVPLSYPLLAMFVIKPLNLSGFEENH